MLSFHSGDVRQIADPGKGKDQISAPWGESRQSKATPSSMNALSKSPPPPPPGITLIGALFGYIHYCTEISEININLLPNTCSFHCKLRRYISLRMRKMCTLEKLNFKISRGSMPPDPPSLLRAFGARYYFCHSKTSFEKKPVFLRGRVR